MSIIAAVVIAAILGAAIGFFGSAILASRKLQRIEKDTWGAANRYYSRRYSDQKSGI